MTAAIPQVPVPTATQIDMTDLDASIKEKWLDGTPVGGITHYDLLQFILETFGSQCTPRIEKMYAVNNTIVEND